MSMRRDDIRALKKDLGAVAFVQVVRDLLEGRKMPNGADYKMAPEEFSLRDLWEGLIGPVETTMPSARAEMLIELPEAGGIDTSAFVAITRLLLASAVIAGYNEQVGVGDLLVSRMPSKRKIENVAGFSDIEGLKTVQEGMPYEDSSMADKYVTTEATKKGRLISVTEDSIREDQTGQLLVRAGNLGRKARSDREKTIINGVLDLNSNVYRPSGSATVLYSTGNLNLIGTGGAPAGFTTAIALQDWTDLQSVLQFHAENVKTDPQMGTGDPILWAPPIIFVPPALEVVGLRLSNATSIRSTITNQETTFNNPMAGRFKIVSSPYIAISGISGAQADWYMGDFQKQFFWQDIIPIQVLRAPADAADAFMRDVVAIFKVRYYGSVFATDIKWVVKIKGA